MKYPVGEAGQRVVQVVANVGQSHLFDHGVEIGHGRRDCRMAPEWPICCRWATDDPDDLVVVGRVAVGACECGEERLQCGVEPVTPGRQPGMVQDVGVHRASV
jgi:hypothetical protein